MAKVRAKKPQIRYSEYQGDFPKTQNGVGPDCKCVCNTAREEISRLCRNASEAGQEKEKVCSRLHDHYSRPENQAVAHKR